MNGKKIISKGPKIVVLGGGTGLSVLLGGLKQFTSNITAVVTVADDGGGSGILREDLGMLAPGDIRACILALANTEPTMENLMKFRFSEGALKGQSFGNLLIAAMNEIYGSFELAVKELSNVLAVTGKVLPMTLEDVKLIGILENEKIVEGESEIPKLAESLDSQISEVILSPKDCRPLDETIEAIKEADLIAMGPGSLYTSVIPNLLVPDIVATMLESKAPKVYINNVMTQPGETTGFSVSDHVDAILSHSSKGLLDYVIANVENPSLATLKRYNIDGANLVKVDNKDKEYLESLGISLVTDKLIDIKKDYIRHDNIKLSEILISLAKTRIFHR